MPPPVDMTAWQRLGRLLAARRVQVGARYKNKNLFATEREINRRMLWQVESGARDTYRPDTIRAIEAAYELVPGSLERTLAGGDLEPARAPETQPVFPEPPTAAEEALEKFPGDLVSQAIWRLPNTSAAERWEMIATLERKRAEIAERRPSQAS